LIPSKNCYIVFTPDYLRCPQPSSNPGAKVTRAAEPFGDAFKHHARLLSLLQWQIEITCKYLGVETPRTSSRGNSSATFVLIWYFEVCLTLPNSTSLEVVGDCPQCSMVDVNPTSGQKGKTLRALAEYRRQKGRFFWYLSSCTGIQIHGFMDPTGDFLACTA
jgi:hypothetical protein